MYVTWISFTCEVSGSTFRKHRCECCRLVYGYKMERVVRENSSAVYGLGQEAARKRAERNANRALENELANGFDLVPCPACGWYQSRMVSAARDEECRWLSKAWALSLSACIICVSFAIGIPNEVRSQGQALSEDDKIVVLISKICAAFALVLSGVFYSIDKRRRRRLDLNGSPTAIRIARAKERGAFIVVS